MATEPASTGTASGGPPVLALGGIERAGPGAVPLAPWCFHGTERPLDDWEALGLPDVSLEGKALADAAQAARALARAAAGRLWIEMNRRHGRQYDRRFWSTLLMPWLIAIAQACVARRIEIERFLELHRDEPFRVPVWSGEAKWAFASINELWHRGFMCEPFNFWLTSEIARSMSPPNWQFVPIAETVPAPAGGPLPAEPAALKRYAQRALGRHRFDNVLGIGAGEALLFSLMLGLMPPKPRPAPEAGAPALETESTPPDGLSEFLDIAMPTIPASLTARFPALEAQALAKRYGAGRLSVKGGVLMFNEPEMFEAAFSERAGERVVCVQHGGVYGISLSLPDAGETEYRHDALVTWGWREHRGHPARAVPLPSPFLSRIAGRHREASDRIVLVGTQMRAYALRLDSTPRGTQVLRYRDDRTAFVNALAVAPRARLAYRPGQPDPSSYEDLAFLERQVGQLEVVRSDFHAAVLAARLVVIDHLGTTPTIALAAGTPTVLLIRPEFWPVCHDADTWFAELADAGILHSDPESAARHVNDVFADTAGWWNRPKVHRARTRWLDRFGQTSPRWRREWLRALIRLR